MKIKLLISFILIAGLTVAGFLSSGFLSNTKPDKTLDKTEEPSAPSGKAEIPAWIEVKKSRVSELSKNGEVLRDFKTGDAISNGMIIDSDSNGSAFIHLPDGSIARLDSKTKLTINEIKFEGSDKILLARFSLLTGRVWSKILQLATPQSIWEVKTANAVATVRGTSFGISFIKDKTNVVGLENKVAVSPIDPKTNEVITSIEAIVEPGKMVILEAAAPKMEKIKEQRKIEVLEIKTAPLEIRTEIQKWVEINKAEDVEYEKTIEKIQEKGIEGEKIQFELQKQILEKSETIIKEPTPVEMPVEQPSILPKYPEKQTAAPIAPKETIKIVGKIKSIEIFGSPTEPIIEGEIIQFKAFAITTEAEKIDVTDQAKWRVLGNIGAISDSGKFQTQLIGEIAEQGFAFGNVIAVWKDPLTNEEFLGNSPIIKVEAAPPTDTESVEG